MKITENKDIEIEKDIDGYLITETRYWNTNHGVNCDETQIKLTLDELKKILVWAELNQ